MRTFRKIMLIALAAGLAAFLIVPLMIPFESSGTQTYTEAAGPNAEFLDINGISVHVQTQAYTGAAEEVVPVIILMHGFGASTFSWRDVITPLSTAGDVIAYDRTGFGFTERPTNWDGVNPYGFEGSLDLLTGLIEHVALGREVVLVGHSAGGQIAAEFARLHPQLVQRLILVDPAIYTTGGAPSWLNWLWDVPQIDRLGPFFVQGIAKSGNDLLTESYFDTAQLTPEVFAGYQAPQSVTGWEKAFWEFTTAPRDNQLVENLTSILQPTLLITGEFDTVVPRTDTEKLATVIAVNKLVIISESAHLPQEEQADVFVSEVLLWLKETATASR
jgi:pimeloyl-ACP methyl ester carboxylesterase